MTSSITLSLEDLGHALARCRIEQGLTQVQLAARANLGVRALQRLEGGEGSTLDTLLAVVGALDRSDRLMSALASSQSSVSPMALVRGLKQDLPRRVGKRMQRERARRH